jgi:hypothetical protein
VYGDETYLEMVILHFIVLVYPLGEDHDRIPDEKVRYVLCKQLIDACDEVHKPSS